MCAPGARQEARDQPVGKGAAAAPWPQACRTHSPRMRRLITNLRWCIGLLSTVNFMVRNASASQRFESQRVALPSRPACNSDLPAFTLTACRAEALAVAAPGRVSEDG